MSKYSPLVSIIMPVYNTERYLRESLDSLMRQTYKNIEIIIVNDGSTDNCAAIIDEYASRDPRIKAFHRKNSGVVATANFAASQANGKYIMRTDSDDVSFNNKVEDLVKLYLEHPAAALVTGNIEVINSKGEFLYRHLVPPHNDEIKRAMYMYNPIANGATLIRKELFDRVGGYDDVFAEDLHLWVKLYNLGEFIATDSAVYRWRVNPAGLTITNSQRSIDKEKEYAKIIWENNTPSVLSRVTVKERADYYFKKFPTHGIAYKHIFLFDLARLAVHMLKHGNILGCFQQLFIIASTGRTGTKIVLNRFKLIIEGKRPTILRTKKVDNQTLDPRDPTLFT